MDSSPFATPTKSGSNSQIISPRPDKDILKKRRGSRPLSVASFTPQKKSTPVQSLLGPIEQELKRRKELIATREDENKKLKEESNLLTKKLKIEEIEKNRLIEGLEKNKMCVQKIVNDTKSVFKQVEVKSSELKNSMSNSLVKFQKINKAKEEKRIEKNRAITKKLRDLKEKVNKFRRELQRISSDYKGSLKLFSKSAQTNRTSIVLQLKKIIQKYVF